MMTNQNPSQGYEIGIFNQLVKNSEEIALTKFKVEEAGKKLILIETKVNDIDDHLTNVETKVNDIDERLTNVETKVNDIDERLTNVETKVNDIDERLTKIEQIGEKILNWSKYVFGGILLSILANILSTPLISNLFH